MIVAGYSVPAEVEARLVERMRAGEFTLNGLVHTAWEAGVVNGLATLVASRIIQRHRREGHILFRLVRNTPVWRWRTAAPEVAADVEG